MQRDEINTEVVAIDEVEIHEIARINPMITGLQFDSFRDDIETKGQLEAVDATHDWKIFNGRTRIMALQSLGVTTVKVKRQPKGFTEEEMMQMADSMENRRHATPTQLAIKAWKLWKVGTYSTMVEAAKVCGVSVKQVQRVNIIGGANEPVPAKQYQRFNRVDILEELFAGNKVLLGDNGRPTDSLQTIIGVLEKLSKLSIASKVDVPLIERSHDEVRWMGDLVDAWSKQSLDVRKAVVSKLYAKLKLEEGE